jgi:hypothetical protein
LILSTGRDDVRDLTGREKDLLAALSGTTKSALSLVPVLGQAIAGWDAYKQNCFNRSVQTFIEHLSRKVEDLHALFQDDYFKTEGGQRFTTKLVDAALDAQLQDKQELFVNALIHAPGATTISELEKLKFLDMLRHLSRAALMVLAEMHKMLVEQVRGPGRTPEPIQAFPLVNPTSIAEKLSNCYDPFLVTSAISEMESQGLFSRTGEWHKDGTGRWVPGGGFATEMCYTDFAARFVEFISDAKK